MSSYPFDAVALTKYLGLPRNYTPSPEENPIKFLGLHLGALPPHLLTQFSSTTTPRERATVPLIKNRRTQYALSSPPELGWSRGRYIEPHLWENPRGEPAPRPGIEGAEQEKAWADANFVGYASDRNGGKKGYVGRLGDLLAEYEEEREAERLRAVRRERAAVAAEERDTQEEFDSESEDGDDDDDDELGPESPEQAQQSFERLLKERFIDGLLDPTLYDKVDYDEIWDPDTRDEEDRWFDEEEAS